MKNSHMTKVKKDSDDDKPQESPWDKEVVFH